MIQLMLPWPPSVNSYWAPIIAGNRFLGMRRSPRAKTYCDDVLCAVKQILGGKPEAITRPVRVDIELRAPDRRERDLDNYLKGLFDSLTNAGVWSSDKLVDEMTVRRGKQIKDGCAIVLISELDGELSA